MIGGIEGGGYRSLRRKIFWEVLYEFLEETNFIVDGLFYILLRCYGNGIYRYGLWLKR